MLRGLQGQARAREHFDSVVGCGEDLFFGEIQFFVQLLARPHPGEGNRHIPFRFQTREKNQLAGQVHNAHGLAHIEDKDLTAMPHRRGL